MTNKNNLITINSRKFDNTINRSWQAKLLERTDSLIFLVGEFDEEVKHSHLGVIRRGTISYEFYWLDRWYNIFRFHEPNGDLRNFYCNINMPPKFEHSTLDYVDLDIDILVWKDFSIQILDKAEFEENSRRFLYNDELKHQVKTAQDEIMSLIENRIFPFDYVF